MRERTPLSVDISELLRRPGATRAVSFSAPMAGLEMPMARVPAGAELRFDLELESLVDGVRVHGTVTGPLAVECRRCLRALDVEGRIELDELFVGGSEAADAEDAFAIVDETIDLEPAVRDAVVLALPVNPLCREECRGLCPTCGADRNEGDCGHTDERIDIRWSELEELRRKMEG